MKYFNNHFLFSETYIKEFINQSSKKNQNTDDIENAFQQVKEWHNEYIVGDYSHEDWFSYIDSVLDVMKFPGKKIIGNTRILYTNIISDSEIPVAVCHYVDKDEDIASTKKGKYYVYDALKAAKEHGVNWAMLTNGYLWRIYNTQNISPYENYLEVNIGESIKNKKADDAFKLFYHFFNVRTYHIRDGELEIDKIKDSSDAKAEVIEEALRGKVEGILKELCYGLKENIDKESYTDEERDAIYYDAIILLYRLLFFGYAESRGLLPREENDPEYIESYKQLCEDAKDLYNAGEVYKIKDGFEFWERLDTQLRLYVDRSYNGGLFDNKDKPILKEHRIANGRLTKCLVELSYNADKTGKYVEPIEYKDLSVRNLGSIYEGLLEYRLFIAEERMVQRKNKRKVKYLRAAEVRLQNADLKNIIEKGEIYLSQDAIERKETGSYYTPEDVVEYIVENTVGKKLNKIKNELLEQKKSLLEQLSYEPVESRKRMLQNQIDEITLDFINKKILSLSVIDSAMGSGHFLVNAAYRVANEIVEIIYDNAWESDNDKLNAGVKYWIRKVVEDCIYGIDINGLAVALARLSLWLISATNDKALSFIDHHLKEGNSIIGTDRKHVEIKDSKYPLFGISYDVFMEPILTKYEQLKKVGSNTKADVLRQQEIYEGIKQDIKIAKKKYDYYLASQYVGGIKDDIEYANLLMSNNIKAFQHKDMQKLWDIAREKKFFHWELEFPEVFQRGGFDIAIGNPPYVDVKEDDFKHTITESIRCKNLYAYMIENTINRISEFGHYGYIIPLSLLTSTSMYSIRRFIISSCSESWMSSYGIRPSKIFQNVDQRVCIIFGRKDTITKEAIIYTTKYILWNAAQRKWLFENIQYTSQIVKKDTAFNIYKISTSIEKSILDKILKKKFKLQDFLLNSRSEHKQEELQNYIYYHSAVRYWIKALDFVPEFINEGIARKSSKYKKITFKNEVNKYLPLSLINSSLFYWFWIITSDCRDLMLDTILNFRVDFNEFSDDITEKFVDLSKLLMCSYIKNSYLKTCKMATIGKVSYREFHPKYSKQIIDSIDDLLGQIYDFTEDEVEFIKNYDIRFRMGDEFTEEDE